MIKEKKEEFDQRKKTINTKIDVTNNDDGELFGTIKLNHHCLFYNFPVCNLKLKSSKSNVLLFRKSIKTFFGHIVQTK